MRDRSRVGKYTDKWLSDKYPFWNAPLPTRVETAGASATVTAAASTNTKGSWTQLIASTSNLGDTLRLECDIDVSGATTGALVDIAFGASGSEVVVIENLAIGSWANTAIEIPLKIPQGTRISARIQANVASRQATVIVSTFYSNSYEFAPTSVDVIGTSTANSRGAAFVSANTYVQLTASTPQAYQAFILCPSRSDSTATAFSTFTSLAIGGSGSEETLFGFFANIGSNESIVFYHPPPCLTGSWQTKRQATYPAGSRLAALSNFLTDSLDVCVIGIPLP